MERGSERIQGLELALVDALDQAAIRCAHRQHGDIVPSQLFVDLIGGHGKLLQESASAPLFLVALRRLGLDGSVDVVGVRGIGVFTILLTGQPFFQLVVSVQTPQKEFGQEALRSCKIHHVDDRGCYKL